MFQIRAEEFSHTILHRQQPPRAARAVGAAAGGAAVSAFKPVVGGGRLGVVGRPLPPAPRPQVPRLDPPPQPPQPAAQPNKRYNPASVYGGGPRRDSDERLESLSSYWGDAVWSTTY